MGEWCLRIIVLCFAIIIVGLSSFTNAHNIIEIVVIVVIKNRWVYTFWTYLGAYIKPIGMYYVDVKYSCSPVSPYAIGRPIY
jgi:hypothetical protein